MLLYIIGKLYLLGLSGDLQKLFFLKGQWENCNKKSKRLQHISLWKCRVLPKYWVRHAACFESIAFLQIIFANTGKLHTKTLISVCPTIFFQRTQHQWTNALKEQCSHLNFEQIFAGKNLSKTEAHIQIRPGTNFLHILLWKYVAWQNLDKL